MSDKSLIPLDHEPCLFSLFHTTGSTVKQRYLNVLFLCVNLISMHKYSELLN